MKGKMLEKSKKSGDFCVISENDWFGQSTNFCGHKSIKYPILDGH